MKMGVTILYKKGLKRSQKFKLSWFVLKRLFKGCRVSLVEIETFTDEIAKRFEDDEVYYFNGNNFLRIS